MTVAIALTGGDAHGAWFDDHQLDGTPAEIRVAVGGAAGPALLDLPDDQLELGERIVVYRLKSTGFICVRHGKGRGCNHVATYVAAGLEQAPHRSRQLQRQLLEDAGLQPPLRAVSASE